MEGTAMSTMIDDLFEKSIARSGEAGPAARVLLAVTLCATVGLATAASAQTAPPLITQSLEKDTDISGPARHTLFSVDLTLRAGESRRVIGQVEAIMKSTNFESIDDTIDIECVELATGNRLLSSTETSLVPGVPIRLRPSLLLTSLNGGQYHCELVAEVTSGSDETIMTALEELTYLAVSAADEVGSHSWQSPECDSRGLLTTCTYLGPDEPTQSILLLYNDGTPRSTWAAAPNVTEASVTANVELTTCGDTASCGNRPEHDAGYSMVTSRLEAIQLTANGQDCTFTASSWRTDRVDEIPHHANIAYSLPNVPVLAVCGSRNFYVRVNMQWVGGNPVKIDGSASDEVHVPHVFQSMTNAFIVASAYAPTTTVPPVIGLTPDAAQPVLAAEQLILGTVTDVESFSPAGTIVAQFAAAGTVEPVGSPVNVLVSLGQQSFTGFGNASKPPTALSLARSRARAQATAAGYPLTHCQQTDESVELNGRGTYDAFVTLTCSRQL
jgi:PASTA domain-containing protein